MSHYERAQDITAKPADGWLHADTALARGDGIFYSFPVQYVGSLEFKESLRALTPAEQTIVLREVIAVVVEAADRRQKYERRIPPKLKPFVAGKVDVFNVPATLALSASAFVIAPLVVDKVHGMVANPDPFAHGIIANHDMKTISLASGGESLDFDLIGYVGKDQRGERACHVFDCTYMSDDVLTTMGQCFVLAKQLQDAQASRELRRLMQHEQRFYNSLSKQEDLYSGVESLYDNPEVAALASRFKPAVPIAQGTSNPLYEFGTPLARVPSDAHTNPMYQEAMPIGNGDSNYQDLPAEPLYDHARLQGTAAGESAYQEALFRGKPESNYEMASFSDFADTYFEVAPMTQSPGHVQGVGEKLYDNPFMIAQTLNNTHSSRHTNTRAPASGEHMPQPAWVFIDPKKANYISTESLKKKKK